MADKIKISASILSANFGELNKEIKAIEKHVDMLHVDVMDGHFVPNLTIGPPVVRHIETKLPMHCHLMVTGPENMIEGFAKAGAERISFHHEAVRHHHKMIQSIKALGVKAGIALNPATPVWSLEDIIDDLDFVLLMSVNPGFGGQKFILETLDKITMLREMKPDLDIEVDGGVNDKTAPKIIEAGANILVSGSYLFGSKNRAEAVKKLRG